MAEPSCSSGKKRARDDADDGDHNGATDETLGLEHNLTFSDTMVALRMMREQFPKVNKSLKKEKVLRLFKLNTGQDDHAIMLIDDYVEQLTYVTRRIGAKSQQDTEAFELFKQHVLESNLDVSIGHQELGGSFATFCCLQCSLLSCGGKVNDRHVTLLINAGLLTQQLIDPNMYWFAIPNIGPILKGLSQGRKELLSFLNRRKYKEMLLAPLEKKSLRLSPLDMRFHLRDLIGSGHLKTIQTPTGLLVRMSRD